MLQLKKIDGSWRLITANGYNPHATHHYTVHLPWSIVVSVVATLAIVASVAWMVATRPAPTKMDWKQAQQTLEEIRERHISNSSRRGAK